MKAQETVMTKVDIALAGSLHGSALPSCQHKSESSTLCDEHMYELTWNKYAELCFAGTAATFGQPTEGR